MDLELELKNITKIYFNDEKQSAVIKHINLQIFPNDFLAIMGPSGSGKTTLMNIIGLLDTPTQGEYYLGHKNIISLTENERATLRNQTIGFVFQQFYLLPRLNVIQNVGLPLQYRNYLEQEINAHAMKTLAKVGLVNKAYFYPKQLSGGQQQRVAIARALVGKPTVILADEPTGSLDAENSQIIMNLFHELHQQNKATIIIVTHDSNIASQCKRVVYIKNGILSAESS